MDVIGVPALPIGKTGEEQAVGVVLGAVFGRLAGMTKWAGADSLAPNRRERRLPTYSHPLAGVRLMFLVRFVRLKNFLGSCPPHGGRLQASVKG